MTRPKIAMAKNILAMRNELDEARLQARIAADLNFYDLED